MKRTFWVTMVALSTLLASCSEKKEQQTSNALSFTGTVALSDLLDAETLNRQSRTQLASALADYQLQRTSYLLKTR